MTSTNTEKVKAYSTQQATPESDREIDARALLSCAALMEQARNTGKSDRALYFESIRRNQRLWTIFQVSLCDPENQLPRDLKITLLNLSRYIDKVSLRIMAEHNLGLLAELIKINRNIAAGLNVKNSSAKATAPITASSGADAPVTLMTTA